MENNEKRSIYQWDLIINGYDLESIIFLENSEYITCEKEDTGMKVTIKVTDETVLHYFDTDDENLIHAYLYENVYGEHEALALLNSEIHYMLSDVPLGQCLEVLNNYDSLNIHDHISITNRYRTPRTDLSFWGNTEYSSRLFYETKFRICQHCYTQAQKSQITQLLSIMENRNDILYGLADRKLSYIMRINSYND